jgi:hypothetical protein
MFHRTEVEGCHSQRTRSEGEESFDDEHPF